jgi:short-subunit dehydrogenase
MSLAHLRVLLTGATGGIGRATARELSARGAAVLLSGRDREALEQLARELDPDGDRHGVMPADLTDACERDRLAALAIDWRGGINALVNNAGVGDLRLFLHESPEQIDRAIAVNVTAPMQLCRALLPQLVRLSEAHLLNVGSVFGAIGYPGYATYCAGKFALRGFTEALAREADGTPLRVHYLAPRATATAMNGAAANQMNDELGVATDPPERVAVAVCEMLEGSRRRAVIGWPEKLFARLNGALPGVVDAALRKQLPVILRFAASGRQRHAAANPIVQNPRSSLS